MIFRILTDCVFEFSMLSGKHWTACKLPSIACPLSHPLSHRYISVAWRQSHFSLPNPWSSSFHIGLHPVSYQLSHRGWAGSGCEVQTSKRTSAARCFRSSTWDRPAHRSAGPPPPLLFSSQTASQIPTSLLQIVVSALLPS